MVRKIFFAVEHVPLATHHTTAANKKHLNRCFEFIARQSNDIEVFVFLQNHLLPLNNFTNSAEAIAKSGSAFKLKFIARRLHLDFQSRNHFIGIAVEKTDEITNEFVILLSRDLPHTRTTALFNVKQQTRPPDFRMSGQLRVGTSPNRKRAKQLIKGLTNRPSRGVGPEVSSSLSLIAPHHRGTRPVIIDCDREERVTLVVTKVNVEPWLMLLDQAVLEHERFELVANLNPLHSFCRGHHLSGTGSQVDRILEIVRQTRAKTFGLTHIDDAAVDVFELIRAGLVGNRAGRRSLHHWGHRMGHRRQTSRPVPTLLKPAWYPANE
ncbi:unannotated protein [freshwater metagenome]|uniref:Unannotated protein n=1 Tax=freshwater metagenome TaxID=449393 RepID=A0A6J6J4A2_9ZZZZ